MILWLFKKTRVVQKVNMSLRAKRSNPEDAAIWQGTQVVDGHNAGMLKRDEYGEALLLYH